MQNRAYIQAASAPERVLVVASDAAASAPLCLELMRRGASVSAMSEIVQATTAVRQQQFDSILVMAREDANATALFLQVLKAEALGSPRVMLLVDPQTASSYGQAIFAADEMLASTLPAARIADATGIGVEHEAPKAANLPAVFVEPKLKVLALPAGLSRDLLSKGVGEIERGEVPDAVILTGPEGDAAISSWMSAATAAVVPIIDATGLNGARADITIGTISGLGLAEAMEMAKPLTARMRQLPEAYHRTRDPKHMLLARLAVRDRAMQAIRDPGLKEVVSYRDETAIGGVLHQAEMLARLGLMERKFFEKVQCCPSCSSSRLLVRCKRVNHAASEAETGVTCMDCDTAIDRVNAASRTYHEYHLTDEGRRQAFAPPLAGYGDAAEADNGASVGDRLRRFVAANAARQTPCAALMIKIDPERETQSAIGDKRFHQALALYASILREVFEQDVEIIEAATTFLVMINDEKVSNVEALLPEIRRELEQNLAVDLHARYHIFGPEEILTLL